MIGTWAPGMLESREFDRPKWDLLELKDRRDGDSDISLLESRLARLPGGSEVVVSTESGFGRT